MPLCQKQILGSMLVVSDDATARDRIVCVLRNAGHHVHEVDNWWDALQCLRHPEFNFDVVISNVALEKEMVEACMLPSARPTASVSMIQIGARPVGQPSLFLCEGKLRAWLEPVFTGNVLLNLVRVAIEHAARIRHEKHE